MYQPSEWDAYVGQEAMKERLQLAIESAKSRDTAMPSVLLLGPPGCGKTTLAHVIADALECEIIDQVMPIHPRLLKQIVMDHEGVFFMDEVHRATRKEQELLLPLLQNGYIQDARGRKIHAGRLHVIAATTEGDKIIRPLWDRFRIKPPFDPYTDEEMARIALNMAYYEGLDEASWEWAVEIGKASLGVPRNAQSLVDVARDMNEVNGEFPDVETVLAGARTTETGLTIDHVRYLEVLRVAGGSAGLVTMRQMLGIPAGHVEMLEIDLMKQSMLERTPTGREITQRGMEAVRRFGNDDT